MGEQAYMPSSGSTRLEHIFAPPPCQHSSSSALSIQNIPSSSMALPLEDRPSSQYTISHIPYSHQGSLLEHILPPPGSLSALPLQYLPMLEYPKSSSTAIALRSKSPELFKLHTGSDDERTMTHAAGEYFGDALQRITTSQKALPIIKPDFHREVTPVDLSVVLSHSKPKSRS
ncbi:MAG: hypothetical protein ACKPKO_51090 [Candidatus Fonsibacter sp.]